MPIKVNVPAPIINRWVNAKCFGFRQYPKTGAIVGFFKILETGEDITASFGSLQAKDFARFNAFRQACGLEPLKVGAAIDIPIVGEKDMKGYDRVILVRPVNSKDGKYVNVGDFMKPKELF